MKMNMKMKMKSLFSPRLFSFTLILSLLLCSCSSSRITVVTHGPNDPGYIPVFGETFERTDSSLSRPGPSAEPFSPSPSSKNSSSPTPPPSYPAPNFLCGQSFVYDVQRKAFLFIEGNNRVVYPASTTKLLTILYAQTLLPLDRVVRPGDELELVGPNSSIAYIKPYDTSGHSLTVEQLIEGMLLPSGNDAAYVLAAEAGRALNPECADGKEAVQVFVAGMNAYAKELGLCGSVFLTPDGYDDEGHYSTLEDMALVARLAYEDPVIRKYSSLLYDDVVYHSGHTNTWRNTNWCLDPERPEYYLPEVNGLKTGAVNKNYYCIISSAEIDGQSFIFGFFGEKTMENRFVDTKTAVEWIKTYILV